MLRGYENPATVTISEIKQDLLKSSFSIALGIYVSSLRNLRLSQTRLDLNEIFKNIIKSAMIICGGLHCWLLLWIMHQ